MKDKVKQFKELNSKMEELTSQLKDLGAKRSELREQLEKHIVDNDLYTKIDKLAEYEGKTIEEIDLVLATGKIKHFYRDELMGVQKGRFYYSSFECGLYEFDDKTGTYKSHYLGSAGAGDIVVGYLNLDIKGEGVVKETSFDYILEAL